MDLKKIPQRRARRCSVTAASATLLISSRSQLSVPALAGACLTSLFWVQGSRRDSDEAELS
jgi:hypothetical protein